MKLYVFSALLACLTLCSQAQEKAKIFSTEDGAIQGYDPVAYFTDSKPVKGNPENVLEWEGANWYFSSQDNLDKFQDDPERYAPQYGGFCAYGVANGYKVKTEPEAWAIVEGKLYLNYDLKVQKQWNADREGLIRKANENWVKL